MPLQTGCPRYGDHFSEPATTLDLLQHLLTAMSALLIFERVLFARQKNIELETAEVTSTLPPEQIPEKLHEFTVPEKIAWAAERKALLCEQLARPELTSFAENLQRHSGVDETTRSELELRHKTLLEQAREVRDSNLVNGKILSKSQHVIREILHTLGGKSFEGLYGHTGQPSTDTGRNVDSIAKA